MSQQDLIGEGYPDRHLEAGDVRRLVKQAFSQWNLSAQRVLVIIPDGTRTAPIPLFFRLFFEMLDGKVDRLDYLVALGTHQAMSEEALLQLVGITAEERSGKYAGVGIFNHRWEDPETFVTLGKITAAETRSLSGGRLAQEVEVRVNRMALDYDAILICGPVFPHEVVGFSGGNKYFFPGISGPELINYTHWLGALITSYDIIGTKDTPVRAVINRGASMIDKFKRCFCLVNRQEELHGLYIGTPEQAWSAAADLSAQVHVRYIDKPFQQVFSEIPEMYDDLWTGAKGMYKMEPIVADGGEVIIYAPHITEVSYTHGRVIDEVGYHVRDYFVKQWEQYKDYPWGVLAHSTHARGNGSYVDGVESPRVKVTLATGIPAERCARLNLGYLDPASIDPSDWKNKESQGILYVPHAGEILYRLKPPPILIIMGVSGSGKTVVGEGLAQKLGWPFYDGDDYHSQKNKAKMSRGIPLTDEDRAEWLETLADFIRDHLTRREPAILACSALKKVYRDRLNVNPQAVHFIHLKGPFDLILERMHKRQDHYMKANMLQSQFDTLEHPQNALTLDIHQAPETIVDQILANLNLSS